MSSNILTVWELLLCLIWKNWCVQWKNWHTVLFCILTPTFFMTIPIVIRCMISCENFPTIIYEPVDLKESWSNLLSVLSNRNYKYFNVSRTNSFNVYVPQMIIAYAPNTYILFNKIMNHAIMSLGGMDLIGYSSCELLYNAMQTKYYFAGVCFDENIFQSNTDEIPSQLNYTLLYPSELRFYHDTYITSNWNTNILFNFVTPPDSRVGRDKTGGYVGYVREGFSSLQHQIFLSYMNLDSVVEELKETFNGVTRIPDILLHRFPYRAHTVDKFLNGIKSSLSLIIIISYTVPVTIFIKYIVEEKEKNLQIVLKNMGAPYALQLISWVVVAFFQLLLSSIILVTLIKIPWSDGNGILPNSSWLALLLVMSLYSLVAATFSVLLSIFFVKAKYAVIITVALWILTFFPYASLLNKLNHEILTRILIFLLPNTTMGLIIGNIQNLEVNDIGIQFKNYFSSQTLEIHFSIGILSITMLLQSIVHMVMAIYIDMLIPDKTGRVKKLNLFLTDVFKGRRPGSSIQDTTRPGSSNRSITVIEVETLKPPILEITNLCKKYDNKYVVQNVNMTLYENDTTILMGHNGSGKKTLLKMIVGLLHPTSGDMKINGIEWTADKGYDDISFAINDQILFGNLTVQDQLTFFCRMKGIEYPKCKMQVIKYLKSTLLKNYSNCYTDNLTLGLKNILALCCALIGDSKIIILCDPFEGLDILTRKYMFNLLLKERIGRTLLLSTNSYDVAETFGNRMAIMANGEIKCSGTPSFLKRVYCYGYCLRILMGKLSKSDDIKKLLRKYIINIEPDYMLGNEISFLLEQKYSYVFDDIFDEFEERWNELNIVHLEVNEHSLRDVFLQYGADGSSYGNSLRHHEILNGISKYLDRSNPVTLFQTYKTLKGRKLILNHWNAYVYKRFIHLIRSPLIFGSIVILPILCTVMPFSLLQIKLNNDDLKPMSYRLQQYQRSATTIEILRKTDPMSESSELEYQQLVFWSSNPHQVEVIETPFEEYLIKQEKLKASKINELYLVAASFKKNYTAWFNNYPLHTVPLSLNLMHNAIARAILGIDSSIELNFQPLPFTNKYHAMMMHVPLSHNMLLPLCTSLCLSFVWSISIIFTIREKITNLKFLQFIAGAKKDSFFLTGLILDILVVLVTGIITVATMMVIDQDRFNDTDVRESYFLTIIAGGICVTSMNHVLGRFFRDPYLAFCVVITIHFFGITNFAIYTEVFYKNHDDGLSYINTLGRILYIMPLFTQCSAMSTIFFINDLIVMCSDQTIYTISTYVENCDSMPNCCVEYSVWDGVSSSIFILMGLTIFYWILMYLMEYMQTCDLFNYKQRSMEQITR
ncbi:retinal-specific phospholipid-transporting ATPase ABCA4-like [Teleopsis dalmanni]|uniref:retinal-specific phospholipid-transporting ATPase ABCA4-like n=1 Tax=Teleopsis dalmanni TaxID=139649 RepID=UPI0018CD4B60|nr:retinal-specific phospholipid-transporting ATPase ABCA4-like [Teleopsis dalmanni]